MTDRPEHTALTPMATQPIRQSEQILAIIERVATSPNFNMEALNSIVALREKLMASEAKSAFDRDLSAMQPFLPSIDARGKITIYKKSDREKPGGPKPEDRPEQETPYAMMADINDAIRPALADHGFALSFRVGQAHDGKLTVTGILSHREGHREETTLTLMYDSTGSKNNVQAVGSSLSYGRRYATLMLLNISSRAPRDMDDDGHAAGMGTTITEKQAEFLTKLLAGIGRKPEQFVTWFAKANKLRASALADIPAALFATAKDEIETLIANQEKKKTEQMGNGK